jgi:hypothetical protein
MKTDVRISIMMIATLLVLSVTFDFAGRSSGSTNRMAAGPALDFSKTVIPVGHGPGSIAIADVNHDGKLDVIVANTIDGTLDVLLSDGKGHFIPAAGSPFPCGKSPNDIATGDFNGDGNLDLVIANTETPYLTILLGDGKGGFAPAPHSPFDTHSYLPLLVRLFDENGQYITHFETSELYGKSVMNRNSDHNVGGSLHERVAGHNCCPIPNQSARCSLRPAGRSRPRLSLRGQDETAVHGK